MNINEVLRAHGVGGKRRHSLPCMSSIHTPSNAVISTTSSGKMYALTNDGTVYAQFSSSLCKTLKDNTLSWSIAASVAQARFSRELECVFAGTSTGYLKRINSAGVEVWSKDLAASSVTGIDFNATHVFVLTADKKLRKYALDGTLVWTFTVTDPMYGGYNCFRVTDAGECIYMAQYKLVKINASGTGVAFGITGLYLQESAGFFEKGTNRVYFDQHAGVTMYSFSGASLGEINFIGASNNDIGPSNASINLAANRMYIISIDRIYVVDVANNSYIRTLVIPTSGVAVNDAEDFITFYAVNNANQDARWSYYY